VQKEADKHGIPVDKAVLFLHILDKQLFPEILKGIKKLEKDKTKEEVEKIAKKYFDSAMQQVRGFCNGRNAERAAKKRDQRAKAKAAKTAASNDPLGNWRTRVNGLQSEFNNLIDKEGLAGLDKMRSVHAEVTAHFQAIIKLTL
jgi:N-acetylneuraminic acid mutarotase